MVILLAFGATLCAIAVVLVTQELFHGRTRRRSSLRRVVIYTPAAQQAPAQPIAEKRPTLLEAAVPALSRVALKLNPRAQTSELQLRLAAAGLASRITAQQFLALKTVLGLVAIVFGFGIGGLSVRGLVVTLMLLAASHVLPEFALSKRVRERAERLSAHLPSAIDQIVVSLEAGLGFDAAVSYFVRQGRSPLAGELRVMLTEIQMGEPRVDALKRLAERVPSDSMRSFVQTLIQSEGMGISRTQILKSQAGDLRNRWQLAAEEQAHKAPVKMLFPIVIFILPVMFVVILGPAIHSVSRLWGK
jgi:tight adherence protein C